MYITKAVLEALYEKKDLTPGKGKITVKNVQFGDIDDKGIKQALRNYKVKIKITSPGGGGNPGEDLASVTGEKKDVVAYFLSNEYGFPDKNDINSEYPKLFK